MNKIQQEALVRMLGDKKVAKAVLRAWDRSLSMTIDEKDGKVRVEFHIDDSGQDIMTIADVAHLLQCDRATVRRLTGARAQHRAVHPLPFFKIGGKLLRFRRSNVLAWIDTVASSPNGTNNSGALSLVKGKVKKKHK